MRTLNGLKDLPEAAALAEVTSHLDAGGDPRALNNAALRWACHYGHLAVVDRLLSLGLTAADARADCNYALRAACDDGHLAVLERLIGLGLTAADARAYNNAALIFAYWNGHFAVVERLLGLGLDVDYVQTFCVPYDVIAHLHRLRYKLTPHILVRFSRQNADTDDWPQRLWRAVEYWEGTPELEAAESKLTPSQLEAWEAAKDQARPRWLRYED